MDHLLRYPRTLQGSSDMQIITIYGTFAASREICVGCWNLDTRWKRNPSVAYHLEDAAEALLRNCEAGFGEKSDICSTVCVAGGICVGDMSGIEEFCCGWKRQEVRRFL
jgi:hypothetical protein